jgi:flagellar basal body rod protein FlgF
LQVPLVAVGTAENLHALQAMTSSLTDLSPSGFRRAIAMSAVSC